MEKEEESGRIKEIIEFKKAESQYPEKDNFTPVKGITQDSLPLTAQNRKIQMQFLRKLLFCVIIQIIVTMIVLALANFEGNINYWLTLPYTGYICFGVGMAIVVIMSLITTFAPYFVRNVYISFTFLSIFGVCLGFIVGGLGNSIYMFNLYGAFIMFLVLLIINSYYVKIEFGFWNNYLIGSSISIVYLIVIDGVILKNWIGAGCLIAGDLFFNFYAIMFSQFIIARNSEMYRIEDYIFGALKFNVDMGDIMMKIAIAYLTPFWYKYTQKYTRNDINKEDILKDGNQIDLEINNKLNINISPTYTSLKEFQESPKKDNKYP